jgi:uncharacterized pyridoxal phosphate-containing UPF0001 family protein
MRAGGAGSGNGAVAASVQDPVDEVDHGSLRGWDQDLRGEQVQELVEKADEVAEIADLRWALIGHLQSNKANQAAPLRRSFTRWIRSRWPPRSTAGCKISAAAWTCFIR